MKLFYENSQPLKAVNYFRKISYFKVDGVLYAPMQECRSILESTEAYSEHCQTSKMERLKKIVNAFNTTY